MLIILDFKIISLWFVIKYWWYNTLTPENNWFLNVLVKSNFATSTPFGSVSYFVVGVCCMSNYILKSFLIHKGSYSKGYQWYLMHREVWGSIWKIGRYPIKASEVILLWPFKRDITPQREIIQTKIKKQVSYFLMRNPFMKFRNFILIFWTEGCKEGRTKAICPLNHTKSTSEHYVLLFSLFYTMKALNGKLTVFGEGSLYVVSYLYY